MTSLEELIKLLENQGCLGSPALKQAFQKIDRADFVPKKYQKFSYENYPLDLDYGQTISQPYTVALMLKLLKIESDQQILDIGCGSGYTTALLAQLTGPRGKVWATDIIPELVELSQTNLKKYPQLKVEIALANKDWLWPEKKFDRILVSAAADSLPSIFIKQLKIGGRLVIPLKHSLWQYEKINNNELSAKEYFGFTFVPLIYKND